MNVSGWIMKDRRAEGWGLTFLTALVLALVAVRCGLGVGACQTCCVPRLCLKQRRQSEILPHLPGIQRGPQEGCGIQVASSTQVPVTLTHKPSLLPPRQLLFSAQVQLIFGISVLAGR